MVRNFTQTDIFATWQGRSPNKTCGARPHVRLPMAPRPLNEVAACGSTTIVEASTMVRADNGRACKNTGGGGDWAPLAHACPRQAHRTRRPPCGHPTVTTSIARPQTRPPGDSVGRCCGRGTPMIDAAPLQAPTSAACFGIN